MLALQKVRWKNLLSTGNVFTEIQLDAHQHTLIVGANGSGKTTMLDALCFALYNKPFRNINKPALVNSTNQKDLLVEVQFETNGQQYLVRRGINPKVFDIEVNGATLPALPNNVDSQTYLERQILKCNYKAFTQVVILGASSYVPFMRLNPQSRRDILEDVLDIEIFSIMQSLLKDRYTTTKDALQKSQYDHTLIAERHAMALNYTNQWNEQQDTLRISLSGRLSELQLQLQEQESWSVSNTDSLNLWRTQAVGIDEYKQKFLKATKLVVKFKTEKQRLEHNQNFFGTNHECPICTQDISENFKSQQLTDIDAKLAQVTADLLETERATTIYEAKLVKADEAAKTVQMIEQELVKIHERVLSIQNNITQIETEIADTHKPAPVVGTLGDLDAAKAMLDAHSYDKYICEHGLTLLKDNGIRTRIVQHYLPVINYWVNHYLQAMNFPIQFILDEQFNETIKSRYRDVFSYENFSDGEKKRIDLALVLTWRAVARMKNSVFANLLIFDEVFDSSLDITGTEDFMRLIQTLEKDTHMFFISHKTDQLSDRFNNTIIFEKSKGFSRVKL